VTKTVLDTNVLVSAVIFGGKPDQILNLARAGKIQLFISSAILAEFAGVLLSKFRFSPEMAVAAVVEISSLATLVKPQPKIEIIKEDEADNRILECALTANADFIVSGDRHLLRMYSYRNIRILGLGEFLRIQQSL
jgi:hypothetical protein